MTRSIPLHRTDADLLLLASSTLEPLAREAEALEVTLAVEGAPALGLIALDPEKIAWVIATLVGNALRYVRHGTRRLPGGTVTVRMTRDAVAKTVAIVVEDDGPGIPEEKRRYLFERQAGSQHAVGLALTLAKDIVEAHGGHVLVKTSTDLVGHGTTVRVTLPTET